MIHKLDWDIYGVDIHVHVSNAFNYNYGSCVNVSLGVAPHFHTVQGVNYLEETYAWYPSPP